MSDPINTDLDRLHGAIGAVAMASARLEETLSRTLSFLAGSEEAWILFTGRPARTVIDQSLAIVTERTGWREDDSAEGVKRLLAEAGKLMEFRNAVVHALWALEEWSDPSTMPWHVARDDERQFYPARSRLNKGPSDLVVTVPDLLELSRRLDDVGVQLVEAVALSHSLRGGFVDPPTVGHWYL